MRVAGMAVSAADAMDNILLELKADVAKEREQLEHRLAKEYAVQYAEREEEVGQ